MSYQQLILELSQNTEKEWIEYKSNNDHPQKIGEYISALANSAKLHSKNNAYMIWGVDD